MTKVDAGAFAGAGVDAGLDVDVDVDVGVARCDDARSRPGVLIAVMVFDAGLSVLLTGLGTMSVALVSAAGVCGRRYSVIAGCWNSSRLCGVACCLIHPQIRTMCSSAMDARMTGRDPTCSSQERAAVRSGKWFSW